MWNVLLKCIMHTSTPIISYKHRQQEASDIIASRYEAHFGRRYFKTFLHGCNCAIIVSMR